MTVKSKWYTAAVAARVRTGLIQGIFAVTEGVRNEAISLILNPPKTGRLYPRRGIVHQASAPGESPASDTGRLVNSMRTRYENDGMTGIVVASTEYSEDLEFGTAKIEPRPFMRPALANKFDGIKPIIVQFLRAALAR